MAKNTQVDKVAIQPVTWVALIFSCVVAALVWLNPLLQRLSVDKFIFGNDWLSPSLLLFLLVVAGVVLDVVAMTKHWVNIVIGGIAALVLISPVVVSVILSAALANAA